MDLTTQESDDVMVVSLNDQHLDASNSGQFKSQLKEMVAQNNKVVLDMSAVNFVDSSGLGAILSGLRLATHRGGDLKISGMSRSVRILFELVRMHKIIEVFAEKDEAVRSFLQPAM